MYIYIYIYIYTHTLYYYTLHVLSSGTSYPLLEGRLRAAPNNIILK